MESNGESPYGTDIYTEPDGDPDTIANLGPLAPLAGIWEGSKGVDMHPAVDGAEENEFVEHYELQPIDRQTNGPQLFYGLRYHTHIVKPRRGRDIPRPDRLLALGAGDEHRHVHARDPARSGVAGRGTGRAGCDNLRGDRGRRFGDVRDLVEPVPR